MCVRVFSDLTRSFCTACGSVSSDSPIVAITKTALNADIVTAHGVVDHNFDRPNFVESTLLGGNDLHDNTVKLVNDSDHGVVDHNFDRPNFVESTLLGGNDLHDNTVKLVNDSDQSAVLFKPHIESDNYDSKIYDIAKNYKDVTASTRHRAISVVFSKPSPFLSVYR